jgi:hypothetical protein
MVPPSSHSKTSLSDLESLIKWVENLDPIFEDARKTLFDNPDAAANKLVVVLEEISKIYVSLDNELTSYLSLSLDDNPNSTELERVKRTLFDIEGGMMLVRVSDARGHCKKIRNIYITDLQGWFGKVLSRKENDEIRLYFDRLVKFDDAMIHAMEGTAEWIRLRAKTTLDHIMNNKFKEANNVIKESRRELSEYRLRMAKAMAQLRELQHEFSQIAVTY